MMKPREIWRQIARLYDAAGESSSRIRALESEVARLRAENRALLNSILGIAGMKPLPPEPPATVFNTPAAIAGHSESSTHSRAADRPLSTPTAASSSTGVANALPPRQPETRNGSSQLSPVPKSRQLHAPAHRRRSWHQINRILEIQSSRKEATSD
jgi:hypothetical protein